jgi:hypothetical protein
LNIGLISSITKDFLQQLMGYASLRDRLLGEIFMQRAGDILNAYSEYRSALPL